MVVGGVHGCGGVCMAYDEIRSMSGQYASYWNAFLYDQKNGSNSSNNGVIDMI